MIHKREIILYEAVAVCGGTLASMVFFFVNGAFVLPMFNVKMDKQLVDIKNGGA